MNQITDSIQTSKLREAIIHALIYCPMTQDKVQNNPYVFIEKINEILKVSLTDEMKEKMATDLSKLLHTVATMDDETQPFLEKTNELRQEFNSFRSQFYDITIRVNELIRILPDYKINLEQDAINREPLYFDKNIGAF